MRKLTAKQEAFAQAIADGKEQSEAYRLAYNCTNALPTTVKVNACRCAQVPHVAARIAELKAVHAHTRFLNRESKREMLAQYAKDAPKVSDRLKAIELDNRMTGENAPTETIVYGAAELMARIRKKPAIMQRHV